MYNFQPISNVLGALLTFLGVFMFCVGAMMYPLDAEALVYMAKSGSISIIVGLVLWFIRFSGTANVNRREGYLIVTMAWFFMIGFGCLPYYFSGVLTSISDMIFESASGFTTTGASIFIDIESLPKGILFWRSMTQWIGGMGIIVLTVAIFPLLGIGGIQLFAAEAPGPTSDKIHPRIKETAKRLWLIYVGLTTLLGIILFFEGMTGFDAINHALTTMATGGFSTKNASLGYYSSPAIQYTITLFMFLAGVNYAVLYFGLRGKFKQVWKNDEFRFYLLVLGLLVPIIITGIIYGSNLGFEEAFRRSLFQIVSIITTTGFITDDYTSYSSFITAMFFGFLFFGACAGSTSGGIKMVRHLVLFKNSYYEFKRILHPRALIRIKMNQKIIQGNVITHILVFLLVYLFIFFLGVVMVTTMGMDLISSAGAVATSLGNVGPGIGSVGPVDNFSAVPWQAKWILTFIMILGRLEIFTVMIIFTPFFWRNN